MRQVHTCNGAVAEEWQRQPRQWRRCGAGVQRRVGFGNRGSSGAGEALATGEQLLTRRSCSLDGVAFILLRFFSFIKFVVWHNRAGRGPKPPASADSLLPWLSIPLRPFPPKPGE